MAATATINPKATRAAAIRWFLRHTVGIRRSTSAGCWSVAGSAACGIATNALSEAVELERLERIEPVTQLAAVLSSGKTILGRFRHSKDEKQGTQKTGLGGYGGTREDELANGNKRIDKLDEFI
jgi:hypothetical protein